ncbi:hypothetical protein APHAL10511_002777 [Amanita phalloides]|nr:hypothetical protein APHAL10511_002777 [Amanita phalloides]
MVISAIYKHLKDGTPVLLSVYPPTQLKNSRVPAIVYFHGGGLVVGNRYSWHPTWLQKRVNDLGFAFIAPDYRLIPPSTGHSVLEDIKDVFTFLNETELSKAARPSSEEAFVSFDIDKGAIAVAGASAGGLCAYLAAVHCKSPKPRAVLSLYGMGGDFLTPHYLSPKNKIFFRGQPLVNPADFSDYLYPFPPTSNLKEIVDSPLAYHPADHPTPGYPANQRMSLVRLYFQLGTYLDYYTGCHSLGLSENLRRLLSTNQDESVDSGNVRKAERNSPSFAEVIPEQCHGLFPQFNITSNWPRTILCHGTADTAVPIEESRALGRSLTNVGVIVRNFEIDGEDHVFDVQANAEDKYGKTFDEIVDTLVEWVIDK